MLRLHDTATGQVRDLAQRDPGKVGLYVCGPTVYDDPHIGHGRATLVFDVLRRYLEWRGLEVDHVSNVTDIDDKIIRRAAEIGQPWQELAGEFEEAWWRDMGRLGAARPKRTPHATQYIDKMIDLIDTLVRAGDAYATADGVYLEVGKVAGYGLLARQSLDSLRSGARVDVNEDKRSPLDFALWKRAKDGEPSWPSPFGDGRPGWHTECVVMSLELLGEGFDLHGGGQDLAFPHHENERAQAVVIDRDFARHWMHHGMVTVGGDKMAKSLGNFTTLTALLEETDPRAYRLLVVQSQYRQQVEVTPQTLADAEAALGRIDALARRLRSAGAAAERGGGVEGTVRVRFSERMDDDLDTPGAIGVVFDALRRANSAFDHRDAAGGALLATAVLDCLGAVGITATEAAAIPPEVVALAGERDEARAARDFAAADRIRGELEALGYVVEDAAGGTRLHR